MALALAYYSKCTRLTGDWRRHKVIGIILPSRGLIFAEVMEALLDNLRGYDYKFYQAIGLRIPDCENVPVEKALADSCTHLWFIEDDTVPPQGALEKLLSAEGDVAAIDYGVNGWGCITRGKLDGEVKWTGLGCTLVKSYVFDKLAKPYFRDDMQLRLNDMTWIPAPANRYGGQDIWFGCHVREAGFKIVQVQGECKHLKLEALGTPEENNGVHKISQKPVIEKHNFI
jgi:hypothetical protein